MFHEPPQFPKIDFSPNGFAVLRSLGSARKNNIHLESFSNNPQGATTAESQLSCIDDDSVDPKSYITFSYDFRKFIRAHSGFTHVTMRRSDRYQPCGLGRD